MINFFKVVGFVIVIFAVLAAFQWVQIFYYTKKLQYDAQPFEKINPTAVYNVLFAGDSTAVGTGAADSSQSTAGWFSQDYPQANIENHSQNGLKLEGMIDMLSNLKDKHYDLAVLQIGANDIIGFTPLKEIEARERIVIQLAKQMADKIIILHSGDIGDAPLFRWPFTWIYSMRTLKVREIYAKSQDERVSYVDIYQLEKTVTRPLENYAADKLHLNGQGYRVWYGFIKKGRL